ncbi:MAG: hypothetical protein L0241_15755 [Planctomycetia bacterium]|nr:hypothetical protein [Planctomycetia bacterium]
MSRLLTASLSAVVLFAFATSSRAADEPKDIIAKAIKAHGGEEVLTKHKAAQSKNKGKINIPGLGETEFTQDVSYMLPDKFKDVMELKVGDKNITVFTLVNGDKVSIEVDGKEIDAKDAVKDALKDASHIMQIARLVPLKEKGYELSLIGEDKVEGKKVIGVRVSKKDEKDVNVYFDKETWLLTKLEYRGAEPGTGKEINEERIITEYSKPKDGAPTPKKIIIKHDGKLFLEAEVLEVKSFEKLDDSEFKK